MREYAPTAETIEAVKVALEEVPAEYREIVFDNIVNEVKFPDGYRNKKTSLQKAQFIYRVTELTGRPLGAREIVHIEYDWR